MDSYNIVCGMVKRSPKMTGRFPRESDMEFESHNMNQHEPGEG